MLQTSTSKRRRRRIPIVGAVLSALLASALAAGQPRTAAPDAKKTTAPASLSKTSLPARGRQEAILTIGRFGRYALTVRSEQGVSLQLVDRMAGPGAIAGRAGAEDGRLDLFLDRGQYKLVAEADPRGSGTMALAVGEFAEFNAPRPPLLLEEKLVETALDDRTQASWWIEITQRRAVALEAAGRNLADLRLWKDGGWLVDAEPTSETLQPEPARPLAARRLSTTLEPGLYLLTAYGGPPVPWAEDSPKHPLYLRFGIPRLPEAGRRRFTVGPFGIDRYLVPGAATYFRLELAEARPAELMVGTFDAEKPFSQARSEAITKQSLPPVAEISVPYDPKTLHVVTVRAPAGQPYLLQHFQSLDESLFSKSGDYWLSTIHSGDPSDSVDATAIVVRRTRVPRPHDEVFLEQVVELDGKTGWVRRCNLLESLTVFVRIRTAGTYEIRSSGTQATFRFEPFFTRRPDRYSPPEFKGSGSSWDLEAGDYILTARPEKKGVLDVLVRPTGLLSFALETLKIPPGPESKPVRAAAQFPSVALSGDDSYHVFLNRQPQVRSGIVLRPLPLDLAEALPVALRPGETVSVPFSEDEPGTLRCQAEDGSMLEISVDGQAAGKAPRVGAGRHSVSVRSALGKTAVVSLAFEPNRLAPSTPLPNVDAERLAALPKFPVLNDTALESLDLARRETRDFLVDAQQPALYRLESTGLLATSGNLRSRTVTSLLRDASNGTGRNFLIQSYLRSGDYQLSVQAQDLSAGHLGLKLSRTPLVEGGALVSGIPARADLRAGSGIVYTFQVRRAGLYTVRAIGLGHQFRGRLEDADGWPIVAPNGPADYTRTFEAGSYRLVVLPEAFGSRVVTLLQRGPGELRFTGHGPHALPLARRVAHLWREPAEGASRIPDAWTFELPAAADTSLELTDEMMGELYQVGPAQSAAVATVPPSRGWAGRLEKGRYRLEAVCVRTNNSVPYRVAVWPAPLLAGLARNVTAPVSLPVSVGTDGLVELSSSGSTDVRGRLYDAEGRLVASNDDRPSDWNFSIAGKLARGTYRLQVDPVGARQARTSIAMAMPRETTGKPLAPSEDRTLSLGSAVHVLALEIPKNGGFLAVSATSVESIGLSLEVEQGGAWRSLGSRVGRSVRLETPLAPGAAHRVRVWSADRRGAPVQLTSLVGAAAAASETELSRGLALAGPARPREAAAIAAVSLARGGVFRVEEGAEGLRACALPETLCEDASAGLVNATAGTLWLVKDGRGTSQSVRARRVVLAAGAQSGLLLGVSASRPALCDLAAAAGSLVLVTARSTSGQPGVALGAPGDLRATAVGLRSAVSVSLGQTPTPARLWAAEPGEEPLDVSLVAQTYSQPRREAAAWGSLSGALSGHGARAYDLPRGRKLVRLAVGAGTVAVLSDADVVSSVHWAGDDRFDETVETTTDRLTLLHTRAQEDRFTAETLPLTSSEAAAALAPGAAFERAMERSGWRRLHVSAGPRETPLSLHVRGADAKALFLSDRGEVTRGLDLSLAGAGGTLLVRHGVGPLVCWVDSAAAPGGGLWADVEGIPVRDVSVPALVALEGAAEILRVASAGPLLLHVRSATPLVTRWKRGDAPARVEAHLAGCDLDVYLPGGAAQIGLRALTGRTLWGSAEITATALPPTGEGLGPEALIPSGGTRGFSFEAARSGPVGVGARADSDVVSTTVWSEDGREIGSGVVQMPHLAPGRYVLAIHVPRGSPPVAVRPALSGIRPPSLDPPDAVIQSYLAPGGSGASFSATNARTTAAAAASSAQAEAASEEEEPDEPDDDPGERTPHR